jgi:DSBA-like thioredoxin domain/LUD domain
MSTTAVPDRFTALPDENNLQATVVALEEHGFSVEVADDLDAARQAVLADIPEGSSVMTNTSVTLAETGVADAINDGGGRWESARNKMFALDFATQAQEMKAIGGQPDYALGSVHAVTAVWDMHELLFHRQKALEDGDLRGYAAQLGLGIAAFGRDRASTAVAARIRRDVASGVASGQVLGTPTLFIDGAVHRGGYDPPTLLAGLARESR